MNIVYLKKLYFLKKNYNRILKSLEWWFDSYYKIKIIVVIVNNKKVKVLINVNLNIVLVINVFFKFGV